MQTLPSDIEKDLASPHSASAWLWVTKIVVPSERERLYGKSRAALTYASEEYKPMAMEVGGQKRTGEGDIPEVVLRVTRLNEELYEMVRRTQGCFGGTVFLAEVNSMALSTAVPALEADFELMQAAADNEWISFTLGVPNPLYQLFPLRHHDAHVCPHSHPDHFKGPRCQHVGAQTSCDGLVETCISYGNQTNYGGKPGMDRIGMSF